MTRSKLYSLSGVEWRGVSVRVLRGVPEVFCSAGVLLGCGVLAQGVFGQL